MTNWQKQVNSQLRLTPLFQLILVDYQSNFRYRRDSGRKRQHWNTLREWYGNHGSLKDTNSPNSSALFFGSPHHCRYVWQPVGEAPGDTCKPGVLLTTPARRGDPWQTLRDCESQEQVSETPGLWRALPSHWLIWGLSTYSPVCQCLRISGMWGFFSFTSFPTTPKEGNYSYNIVSLLLSWHVHPAMLAFFSSLCSNCR